MLLAMHRVIGVVIWKRTFARWYKKDRRDDGRCTVSRNEPVAHNSYACQPFALPAVANWKHLHDPRSHGCTSFVSGKFSRKLLTLPNMRIGSICIYITSSTRKGRSSIISTRHEFHTKLFDLHGRYRVLEKYIYTHSVHTYISNYQRSRTDMTFLSKEFQ